MKKSVLVNVSYIVEIDEDTKLSQSESLNSVKSNLSKDITINSKTHLKWESTSLTDLEQENLNCGKCQKCWSMGY